MTTIEQNKAIARRFFEAVSSQSQQGDELLAADFVSHVESNPPMDRAAFYQFQSAFYTGFPNCRLTVEDQVAEGNLVATRVTFRGTHQASFQDIPATGKQVTFKGMNILRIEGGTCVEQWAQFDALGLMQQLGITPVPATPSFAQDAWPPDQAKAKE